MNQRQNHSRTASQGRKALSTHARQSKQPPLRRGTSYNQQQPPCQNASRTQLKSALKKGGVENGGAEDEESGMASFLQFCATCERQIVTPGINILYCSESCRKKDISRPPSIQSIEAVKSPSAMFNAASYFDNPPADIVPQMSPTRRPWSMTFSEMPSMDYAASEDASDRIDWQPTEASQYLGEFFHTPSSTRPNIQRTATDTNLPSLVHSPSSSWGTVASLASYRPLASRQHPFTTDHNTKSIDLVIPYPTAPSSPTQLMKDASFKSCASTITSFRFAEAGDISYDKRSPPSPGSVGAGSHSRRQLFSHEAIKAPPKADH